MRRFLPRHCPRHNRIISHTLSTPTPTPTTPRQQYFRHHRITNFFLQPRHTRIHPRSRHNQTRRRRNTLKQRLRLRSHRSTQRTRDRTTGTDERDRREEQGALDRGEGEPVLDLDDNDAAPDVTTKPGGTARLALLVPGLKRSTSSCRLSSWAAKSLLEEKHSLHHPAPPLHQHQVKNHCPPSNGCLET